MGDFVRVLVAASERAANIARAIRKENELFQLLTEEKSSSEKNSRFVHDFKTLADVLIQESLRHEISAFYPEMANNIYGEENNTFTNCNGETVTITIEDSSEKTAEILAKVLEGNLEAAKLLADEVHKELNVNERETSYLPNKLIDLYSDVGVWIDPIDATNEYIKGSAEYDQKSEENENEEQIWPAGLHCVTVLIGAFHLHSGQPIVGVVNQPFWKFEPARNSWQGRFFWGMSTKELSISSLTRYPVRRPENSKKIIILSPSEDPCIQSRLNKNFDFVYSSGAGFKLLCVALGLADIYLLTKNTTHYWDTCGPHAILKSLGGGVANFDKLVTQNKNKEMKSGILLPISVDITYRVSNEGAKESHFANLGGIMAYRENQVAFTVVNSINTD